MVYFQQKPIIAEQGMEMERHDAIFVSTKSVLEKTPDTGVSVLYMLSDEIVEHQQRRKGC